MKISRSMFPKFCFLVSFICIVEWSSATNPTVLLPPDGTPKDPPSQVDRLPVDPMVSAIIRDENLAVSFSCPTDDVTVVVFNKTTGDIYYNLVSASMVLTLNIVMNTWNRGEYTLSITYGVNNQQADFQLL